MALMSSSTSGQWTPCPVPIISKCCRCSGVASDNRHDHARGTLMVRPSARYAVMRSSVTSTVRIRGSLLATVVMPCLQDTPHVLQNQGTNSILFTRRKPMIVTQCDRSQPKVTEHTRTTHMDMRGFIAIKAVEEQAIGSWDIGNRGHAVRLTPSQENKRGAPQYT